MSDYATILTIGYIPVTCSVDRIMCGDPEGSETKEVNIKISENGGSTIRLEDERTFDTQNINWFDPGDSEWDQLIVKVFDGYHDKSKLSESSIILRLWALFVGEGPRPRSCVMFDDNAESGEFANIDFNDGLHWYFRYQVLEDDEYFNEQIAVIRSYPRDDRV